MPVIKRISTFVSQTRWPLGAAIIILAISFSAFDLYIRKTGTEIINGWIQNEAISIQQGNLLTSITKNQRLLLSSDFIRGISLVDPARSSHDSLIAFGTSIPRTSDSALRDFTTPALSPVGVFQYVAVVKLIGPPELHLKFLIAPRYAPALFFLYALTLTGVAIMFLYRALVVERQESKRRGELLQIALNDFVEGGEPSPVIVCAAPRLIEGWNDLKKRLVAAQEQEIHLISSARLADLARQVSHDIRSPLSALNMIISSLKELPEDKRLIIRSAAQRIKAHREI